MAFVSSIRRLLSGSSSASSILHSQYTSIRFNTTLTSPKLFISGFRGELRLVEHTRVVHTTRGGIPVYLTYCSKSDNCCCANPGISTMRQQLVQIGLSRLTTDEKLKEAFSPFGQLLDAKVIADRATGRSKGFGFVTYTSIEEAEKAREGMNAKFLDGWVIFVDPAKPREPRPPPQPLQETSDMGFRTNKTVGWCG